MNISGEQLIPKHGGYRKLKSFQMSQLVYDITVRFCDKYVEKFSRTRDQMVQAARSGVQNIAEGSQASGTSKKTELKLTNVARASLEELKLDYEDFLRQRGLSRWAWNDKRYKMLINRRCTTADEVAHWIKEQHDNGRNGRHGQSESSGLNGQASRVGSISSIQSIPSIGYPELVANAALVLLTVACSLLDRQIASLAESFQSEGGFTERLYRLRSQKLSALPRHK